MSYDVDFFLTGRPGERGCENSDICGQGAREEGDKTMAKICRRSLWMAP